MKLLPCLKDIIELKKKWKAFQISNEQFWKKYKRLRREFQQSEEWKTVRKEVRERDVVCRLCGKDHGRLEVHHIIFLFTRPDLALHPLNLILLCIKCHKAIHKKDARLSKASKTRRNCRTKTSKLSHRRTKSSSRRTSKFR